MARINRREVLAEDDVQVVHCINRCVRRGFLCGDDSVTGKNFDHRRQWIRYRLEFLASVFGVEVMAFSVMSNHFHCVLRTRPDVVKEWSDEQVARRWWKLFPQRRDETGAAADPNELEFAALLQPCCRHRKVGRTAKEQAGASHLDTGYCKEIAINRSVNCFRKMDGPG
ncbi:MAG: hypothetical protein ABJZ55_05930 [Fuerstiella sp.]